MKHPVRCKIFPVIGKEDVEHGAWNELGNCGNFPAAVTTSEKQIGPGRNRRIEFPVASEWPAFVLRSSRRTCASTNSNCRKRG